MPTPDPNRDDREVRPWLYAQPGDTTDGLIERKNQAAAAEAARVAALGSIENQNYQGAVGQLRGLEANQGARMAQARDAQVAAADALAGRSRDLSGSQAVLGLDAARDQAQVAAMHSPQAILAGGIGQQQAAVSATRNGYGALSAEAAQRQQASQQSLHALGQGILGEAEQRRLTEAELQRDMQMRFAAAQQVAANNHEQQQKRNQAASGQVTGLIGAGIGLLAGGGPAGASAGYNLGSKVGGG